MKQTGGGWVESRDKRSPVFWLCTPRAPLVCCYSSPAGQCFVAIRLTETLMARRVLGCTYQMLEPQPRYSLICSTRCWNHISVLYSLSAGRRRQIDVPSHFWLLVQCLSSWHRPCECWLLFPFSDWFSRSELDANLFNRHACPLERPFLLWRSTKMGAQILVNRTRYLYQVKTAYHLLCSCARTVGMEGR